MTKYIFITGVNGQLGKSLAEKYGCRRDWNVLGMDLEGSSTIKDLYAYHQGSVTDKLALQEFFNLVKDTQAVALALINNAGVSVFTPPEERTIEEFRHVSEVNLLGPIFATTLFKEKIVNINQYAEESIDASIINISSIYGIRSPDNRIYTDTARNNSEIYGASKAGLIQMTKYFACRYAEIPIQINCVAPGGILNKSLQGDDFIRNYSERVPMKRMCYADEVAELCYSLTTNKSKYITGQTIAIDGGLSSW